MTIQQALVPYTDTFQKYLVSLGLQKWLPLVKILGFQWLPDIVLTGNTHSMLTVVGSSVSVLCFLLSAEVFGMGGFLTYSMIFGAGSLVGALVRLTNADM